MSCSVARNGVPEYICWNYIPWNITERPPVGNCMGENYQRKLFKQLSAVYKNGARGVLLAGGWMVPSMQTVDNKESRGS